MMKVNIGRVGGGKLGEGKGSAGFRVGIMGPLRDYRNSLIYGQGLDAGFTSEGKLFIGNPANGVPIDLSRESLTLILIDQPPGETSAIELIAVGADREVIARVKREDV